MVYSVDFLGVNPLNKIPQPRLWILQPFWTRKNPKILSVWEEEKGETNSLNERRWNKGTHWKVNSSNLL
jgi:hypothetical protein